MKKQISWLMLSLPLAFPLWVFAAKPGEAQVLLKPTAEQAQAAAISAQYLSRHHYRSMPLDDAMSNKILERYLKSLDGEKLLFVQADIDQFSKFSTTLDDAIKEGDLTPPFIMFSLYQQRINERYAYARDLLKRQFDFTEQENYAYNREKANWAKSENEIAEIWRKRVKNDWLRLKLAGKDDKAIRETLDKRYENILNRLGKLNQEDVFQLFLNAYATSVDPHTNYFAPRAAENFNIAMKLSLIGIGAVLQQKDEYTIIRELVPGGPAALSGKLKVGDKIVGVGQGENGNFVDVLGWRLDDVVGLVRGNKDSIVRLDIIPVDAGQDAQHKSVTLARKKISMAEQSAKKNILTVPDGDTTRRIGVISLPTFYQDFEARAKGDKDFKSATRDVARILAELKTEKVDSILIDLRNNGGGSLNEAVELTGLFIDKGPVVMQRNSEGRIQTESDVRIGYEWSGPMGVLINRGSASASEIFAAAIQDYGRGVVIGEASFGKGTVQTLVSLDQVTKSNKPLLGELKLTIAQFFRVNGGTTQLRGVTPDVTFAALADGENFGESSYDNALPYTTIKPAEYTSFADLHEHFPVLQTRHQARIAKDKDFQYLQEDVAEFRKLQKEESISLNETVRRKEIDIREARAKARQKLENDGSGLTATGKKKSASKAGTPRSLQRDDGLTADERNLSVELAAEKEQKNAKDVLLTEAARILSDEIDLQKQSNTRFADRVGEPVVREAGKVRAK